MDKEVTKKEIEFLYDSYLKLFDGAAAAKKIKDEIILAAKESDQYKKADQQEKDCLEKTGDLREGIVKVALYYEKTYEDKNPTENIQVKKFEKVKILDESGVIDYCFHNAKTLLSWNEKGLEKLIKAFKAAGIKFEFAEIVEDPKVYISVNNPYKAI